MSNDVTNFDFAVSHLLSPTQVSIEDLHAHLNYMMRYPLDYADLYFQSHISELWALDEQIVKRGQYSVTQGVGVRAIHHDRTGFAYSNEITNEALKKAATAARGIVKAGQSGRVEIPQQRHTIALYGQDNPIESIETEKKIQLLKELDEFARAQDSRIRHVSVTLAAAYDIILIIASDGTLAADVRPLVRLNVTVLLADQEGRTVQGNAGAGGRFNYDYFLEGDRAQAYVLTAIRRADLQIKANNAPAGNMPVVLGAGWPAVLLHEAVGHGLEGDFNRKKTSAFADRLGEQVASPLCTIVDDGTLAQRRGSLTIDDEGTPTQCTTLIKDGILTGYMQDKMNARLMGMAPTGNARRQSYAHTPLPRMTNTYMLAGKDSPESIISSVENGIYAVYFGGGEVDITSGKFVFTANETYLIKQGKIVEPIKAVTLIGNGPEVLKHVSRVGNDLALDEGVGICGKSGQSVPVGVGQPTLLIDNLTVGGTH